MLILTWACSNANNEGGGGGGGGGVSQNEQRFLNTNYRLPIDYQPEIVLEDLPKDFYVLHQK